jgi:hypothetical protein
MCHTPSLYTNNKITPGFNPSGDKSFAVKGNPLGLSLSAEDRKSLIAFLKTL